MSIRQSPYNILIIESSCLSSYILLGLGCGTLRRESLPFRNKIIEYRVFHNMQPKIIVRPNNLFNSIMNIYTQSFGTIYYSKWANIKK